MALYLRMLPEWLSLFFRMRQLVITVVFLFCGLHLWATHNRAGEITYEHVQGFTYEITITTCTKTSAPADRPWLKINWGDIPFGGELDSLERSNIQTFPDDAQINTYVGLHTYSGPGVYLIQMADPNRNEGVVNILNSVQAEFCIQSLLIINPQTGNNNSVQLTNDAKGNACLDRLWKHNPGAYDPDGDSLAYSLIVNLGSDLDDDGINDPLPGYNFPDDETDNPDDVFSIDPTTGTVSWDVVSFEVGEYNIAILIEEFREVNGQWIKVGHVIRDMQITVENCPNNPPIFEEVLDTCIEAYTNISFQIEANDPDGDNIDLQALGGPFSEVEHPAFFTDNNDGTGFFSWTPECAEVRASPYQVLFEATDFSADTDLQDYLTVNITVVAPAVENPSAEPDGNSFILNWDSHICVDHLDDFEIEQSSYKIYRRQGSYGFEPSQCETGVPAYTGYELVGTVEGLTNTTYIDDQGVFYGGEFCYMIVTCFPDGAESYASEEFCAEIIKDRPVMTNVSIESTELENGQVYIAWSPATALDTENFPGPYRYELFHSEGFSGAQELIYSSDPNPLLINEDTLFSHNGQNTLETPHVYRVNLWSGEDLVGSSVEATSPFIELEPGDQQITVFVTALVPWNNATYEYYRRAPGETDFVLIATTEEPAYTDTGLTNNTEYCYFVRTIGGYDAGGTIDPIVNDSQEACGFAIDLTPPCTPELTVDGDCETETVFLSWTNPNEACEETDDTALYNLYYSPTEDGELEVVETFTGAELTSFIWNEDGSLNTIAGCYAVTALDSLTPGFDGELIRNESELSEIFCVDNCPLYFLPNIFSPNNDNVNDLFLAAPFKFIESVDFKIFNRWGGLVFETTDPFVRWDGTHRDTGEICSDGVYYYVAKVNTIRLAGIVTEELTGTITLVDGANPINE